MTSMKKASLNERNLNKINFQIEDYIYDRFLACCAEHFDVPTAVFHSIITDFLAYYETNYVKKR